MPAQSYRDLDAWKLSMVYGLTSQLRRAAAAIPSNISEGHQQGGRTYLRHVLIALGSMAEAETRLEIARRMNFIAPSDLEPVLALAGDVRRLMFGLRRTLRNNHTTATRTIPDI